MNDEKYFLIVNLIAGQGRCKAAFPKVKAALERLHIAYDLHYTNEPMEAVDVAKMGIDSRASSPWAATERSTRSPTGSWVRTPRLASFPPARETTSAA
jgi:hypothetical protein